MERILALGKFIWIVALATFLISCGEQPVEDEEFIPIDIIGVAGSSDDIKDEWLTANTSVVGHWEKASIASMYYTEIMDSSGTMVCARKSTSTNSFTFSHCTLSPGGSYKLYVSYKDNKGNTVSATNNGFAFTVDYTSPNISLDTYPSNPDNNDSPTFEFTASDNTSGVASIWCKVDTGAFTQCASPLTLYGLSSGNHTFSIKAIDNVGNESAPETYNWDISTTGIGSFYVLGVQGGTDSTSDSYLTSGTQPHLYWETASLANSYDITIRDASNSTDVCVLQNTTSTNLDLTGCILSEGTSYKALIIAKDSMSNTRSASNSPFDFTVDSVAPVNNFTVTPTDPSTESNPTFEFTANDATSAVASIECQIDSGGFSTCTSPYTTSSLADGNHTFEVRSTDAAGNVSNPLSYNWTINAGPGAFVISGVQGGTDTTADSYLTNGSNPHVYWTASSNAVNYKVVIRDASDSADVCPEQQTTTSDFNFSSCTLSESQSYLVKVSAFDASEVSVTATNQPFSFTVDSVGPSLNFSVTPTDPTLDTSSAFEFTSSDSASGIATIECQLDSGSFSSCSSPHNLTGLSIGSHTFGVKAIDIAGNESNISYSWTISAGPGNFDISGVQGSSDSIVDEYLTNGSTAHVYWTLSSNATNYKVLIRNASDTADVCAEQQTSNTNFNFSSCSLSESQSYLVKVTAFDADNFSIAASNQAFSFLVDTVGPSTTLTDTPTNPSSETTTSFSFTTSDGSSGVANIMCQIDGGGYSSCSSPHELTGLSTGDHTFNVQATDLAGNTSLESYAWNITAEPNLQFSGDNPYNFNQVALASAADYTVTVTNVGVLDAQNILASGLSSPFSYKDGSYPGTGGTCATSLLANDSCTIVVTFSPTSSGFFSSYSRLDYDDGLNAYMATINFDGEGITAPAEAISNLQIISSKTTEIDISWTAPFDNYTAITDYVIQYKETANPTWLTFADGTSTNTSATVTGLTHSTSYEFKVISYNGSYSSDSNIATGETAIDNPFFDPNLYKSMNIGGATESALVAFEDSTEVKLNGTVVATINAGQTYEFNSVLNDIIEANNPVFVAGAKKSGGNDDRKGNMVWATPDWAGKEFIFTGDRYNPHKVTVYAFENTTVTITQGGTTVASQVISAETNYTFSIAQDGGFVVSSTGFIVAHMHSNGSNRVVDARPLLPASTDIIGFPSNTLQMTPLNASTTYTAYHGEGSQQNTPALAPGTSTSISPQGGTSSLYQGYPVRVIASDKVVGISNEDSDGSCSAPFLPVTMMKKRYAVNVAAEWVAFSSIEAGTIDVLNPSGNIVETIVLTRTGSGSAPYKARLTNQPKGYRFISTIKFAAWYEPQNDLYGSDNDETIMYGFD